MPDPGVPSGFARTFVTVYAPGMPADGDSTIITSATRDVVEADTTLGTTADRPIWTVPVELPRGESTELVQSFIVPRSHQSPRSAAELVRQRGEPPPPASAPPARPQPVCVDIEG